MKRKPKHFVENQLQKLFIVSMALIIILMNSFVNTAQASPERHEVVFVMNNLTEDTILLNGVKPGIEVYTLDSAKDGLQQMADILSGKSDIDAIHLLSHGTKGQINLGSVSLNNDNIQNYNDQLEQIGASLTEDGDILLYGCNVAEDSKSQDFVKKLGLVTGADIAASTDELGVIGLDWELEYTTGSVEALSPFKKGVYYPYKLSSPVMYYTTVDSSGSVAGSDDKLAVFNTDGTNHNILASAFAKAPNRALLDMPNDRILVWDNVDKIIYSYGLTSHSITPLANISITGTIGSMVYDYVNQKIYYTTIDSSGSSAGPDDKIGVFNLDGSNHQILASSISKAPNRMILDTFRNRALIWDNVDKKILALDLTTNAITSLAALTITGSMGGFAYDPIGDRIFYTTYDSSGTVAGVDDKLGVFNADGSNHQILASNISNAPTQLALDLGNDTVWIWENVNKQIYQYNLNTNNLSSYGAVTITGTMGSLLYYDGASPTIDLNGSNPANLSSDFLPEEDIQLKFSERVIGGSGIIYLYNTTSNSQIEAIPVNDPRITGWGTNTLTINPDATLSGTVAVRWSRGAIRDYNDNYLIENSSNTYYSFSVASANTAPAFTGSTITLTVNQNAPATDITGLLSVSDTDSNQTLTWSQSAAPDHGGQLLFTGAIASSGSTQIAPGGTITYTPATGYFGSEAFTVQVSDGVATATKQITVTINAPAPQNSTVTPTIAVFDKYAQASGYADVTATITPRGNTLSDVTLSGTSIGSANYSYDSTSHVLTLKKEYLATLGTGAQVFTVEMSAGTNPTLTVTISDTTPQNSTVTPTTAVFDKYAQATGYADVTATITPRGNTLSGVTRGGTSIGSANYSYDSTSHVLTLKKEYLATLGTGAQVFTVEMSAGTNPTLTVTISDTTPQNSTVTPTTAVFDKYAQATGYADVTATITPRGNTLSDVKLGGTSIGGANYSYDSTSHVLTLKKEYLSTLGTGAQVFTVEMSAGTNPTLTVTISDTTPQNSTVTPTAAAFDKYAQATGYADVTATITPRGNTLSGVLLNGTSIGSANYSYDSTSHVLTLKKEYLATLGTGAQVFTVEMSAGTNPTLTVTISDTTPQNSTVTPTTAVFDKYAQASGYADVTATITPRGNTLSDVTLSGTSIGSANYSYDSTSHVLTLKKEYLATLGTGAQVFTVEMSAGMNPMLTVTISDTTPQNSTVTPTTAVFDKYAQATGYADVTAMITPRGNTLSDVTRGGTSIGSSNYSYDSTSHVLTLKKEYLATLGTGAQDFMVEMSAGTNPTLTVTISDTTPQNSTVTPTTAVFDKYAQASGYADVTATITPRGNTLSSVTRGGTSIGSANYSYDSTSHVLTLKKEYLATLGTGAQVFTVEMSAGTNPTLTVTISDTTPQNSTVTPTTAVFDKYAQATGYADVTATITPRGNTLSSVTRGGTSIGSANYSYDSTSHVLTLKKEYLATLGTGAQVFTVEMSAGTNPTLTVTISDTTPQNSTVTPTTAVFDKYAQATGYADVTATITPRGNTMSGVLLNGTSIGSANYSYDSTSHVLTLKKEYLATLGTGAQVFTVEMSAGTNPTLTVTISDTTPQNSTVTPTTAVFDKYAQATGYADVTATITPRGNTLSGVLLNGTNIGSANYSYDSTSHVLTLKKEYLATLGTGAQVFTVEMSAGTNPTLTVTISDTTPQNSTVTPTTAVFDKYAQATGYADVTATITPRGNTLSSVTRGGNSIGSANYSYDSTSHVLTLKKEYLATLGTGAQVFTVEMSAGTNPTLTVTISDTTPQNSTVTPTTAVFDKYAQASGYADVTAMITPRGNTLSDVTLGGTSIGSTNYSYDSTSHVLTLKKEYLATLGTRAQVFTVEMSAGTNPTLTVTISDTTPRTAPNLTATAGNRMVVLSWDTVTGATYYNVYMSEIPGVFIDTALATVTEATYQVQNLNNGTAYYFLVKAGNTGGLNVQSNEVNATPATTPAAPTNLIAVAGNGSATITFNVPSNNGGSSVIGYEVYDANKNLVGTGNSSPITVSGLKNGTTYSFTVKARNAVGESESSAPSNAVTPREPINNDDGGSTPNQPAMPASQQPASTEVVVLVNGKVENAGTAATAEVNGQQVTTIIVDEGKLQKRLDEEGTGAVITIPVSTKSQVLIGELNGRMVKNMENQQAVVEIRTEKATYTLPAGQVNIDALSKQFGTNLNLQDIKVKIEIAEPQAATVRVVEAAANQGGFSLVVPPLNFRVTAGYGERTEEISNFNIYVKRTVAIPEGVDPNRITTGVVVEADGTVRHVPTKIVMIEGKYYAEINSLTNSTYTIVWHPLEFKDIEKHWAKDAVNNMGSRMVVTGTGDELFSPDRDITRAEFAAIIVRGLGLRLETSGGSFTDVKQADWYSSAIQTAYKYGLITGYEDGSFRPNDKITREQAMLIVSKAMKLTGLSEKIAEQSASHVLGEFSDAGNVANWSLNGVADSISAGIIAGRSANSLAPKAYITRAEVATMMQRLLQKSSLINE